MSQHFDISPRGIAEQADRWTARGNIYRTATGTPARADERRFA